MRHPGLAAYSHSASDLDIKFPKSSWQSSFSRLSNSPEPLEYTKKTFYVPSLICQVVISYHLLDIFPVPLAGHNKSCVPSKSSHFSSRDTRRTPLMLLWTPENAECHAMCHPSHNFSRVCCSLLVNLLVCHVQPQ